MSDQTFIQGDAQEDVELYWAEVCELGEDEERRIRGMVSPRERTRLEQLCHEPTRRCYLVTRRLVRRTLSRLGGRSPDQWRFEIGDHGRPRLANPTEGIRELDFNVAHSRRRIALAVARGCRVGVDIEPESRQVDHELVARKFFHADERRVLQQLDGPRRRRRFLQLWVLKESWMKADGRGIGAGLDEVVFEFEDADRPRLVGLPDGDPGRWSIGLGEVDDHLVAVARRDDGP